MGKGSCIIENCRNNNPSLTYHTLPKDKELKRKWFHAIIAAIGNKPPDLKISLICSKHFLKSDYLPTGALRRKHLKPFAIPSIFQNTKVTDEITDEIIESNTSQTLPKGAFSQMSPKERIELMEEMGALHVNPEELNVVPIHPADLNPEDPLVAFVEEQSQSDLPSSSSSHSQASSGISLKSSNTQNTPRKVELIRKEIELLTLRSKEKFTLTKFVNDDKAIKYFTGFPSYEGFWAFYQLLLPECTKLNYVGQESSQMTETSDKEFLLVVKPGPPRKLNPMEEFFLTLIRLRQGTPEQYLAYLYNLSQGYVSKIVNTWILFLFECAPHLPVWPSLERTNELATKKITEKYPGLRLIVDCTEFELEKPSASEAQRESFSAYKHANTAKALIGMAPSGHITFCSNLYAGRTSDKKLFMHCGILDMLDEGDAVMADRGFDVAKELASKNVTLIIPEFLKQQDQFTSSQLSESRSVAVARIHVERAIGRVKEFKILKGRIPLTLSPMLEKIYIVCCYLSNFTGTLVTKLD